MSPGKHEMGGPWMAAAVLASLLGRHLSGREFKMSRSRRGAAWRSATWSKAVGCTSGCGTSAPGIEGNISFLKRIFGLDRCTWKSWPSSRAMLGFDPQLQPLGLRPSSTDLRSRKRPGKCLFMDRNELINRTRSPWLGVLAVNCRAGAAFFLFYRLIMFALHRKGDLRAGAQIGSTSFFLEVHDKGKKSSSRKSPS